MKGAVLEAKRLSKSYGKRRALVDLDLRVDAGDLVSLVGENGAGKTTTLAILSGQLVPDGGEARIGGHDVYADPIRARRLLGYVAQESLLPPLLTVREAAAFVCAVKGVRCDEGQLGELLAITGLNDDGDRLVGELSHGMQRKAGWVVALVAEPELLLLDEGLAGLDAASSDGLVKEVGRRLEGGAAVLWTEHDLTLIVPLLSRVVVLNRGELVETVTGDQVRKEAAEGNLGETMQRWTAASHD